MNWPFKGTLQDCENKLKAEVEWMWLDKVHVNGQQLEYAGSGDYVGSALAKMPLSRNNHYFEMEIIDPGLNCCIGIGLARKDYPRDIIPGCAEGSIGYDVGGGIVYMGSSVGYSFGPFGPLCNKGDFIGCGVMWYSEDEADKMVRVYFTKNGKIFGDMKMVLPMGGFFPTVGMCDCQVKVRVDLKRDSN